MKGTIYERWLALLQQFNFEIQYKPAREMVVPDCLSRIQIAPDKATDSPDEEDPFFPIYQRLLVIFRSQVGNN